MTDSNQHRRHFTRIHFDTDYRLSTSDGKDQWSGHVVDLSLHGMLIDRPANFSGSRGDDFLLELILSANDVVIKLEAQLAHAHDDLIGFECKHIDVESMTHLRRVLELNLGDPNLMEREIAEMIDINQN